jgi:tRNA 2-thiocytidine biosynthesis protein TtcA
LYRFAGENGVTKVALGHHRDDIVETLFLNLFFGGRLKAMAPKLLSEDGRHIVIRPLAYVAERDIERYARGREFPIIPCKLCGSQDNMQRVAIKRMLADWERDFPGRTETIFSALRNVELDHLADTRKFDFAGLDARRTAQMTGAGVEPPAPGVALPLPKLGGFMSASEEAELDERLESVAISA